MYKEGGGEIKQPLRSNTPNHKKERIDRLCIISRPKRKARMSIVSISKSPPVDYLSRSGGYAATQAVLCARTNTYITTEDYDAQENVPLSALREAKPT